MVTETVQLGVATLTPSFSDLERQMHSLQQENPPEQVSRNGEFGCRGTVVPELNQRCIQSVSEGEPDEQLSGCAT